ncbi:amino acid ABC transporter permease [Paraburkholderia sp. MMS20-SJTR3]|uniref:Amino acid ABC transporter permease n=1 Tax=Paraburkholderia sejongensis TaxID=2886946 RepID=A0ABS8K3Y7_9BURK|nr:amino acid ABC transporter permease [Paraburkholderia sp. MMS20-SJTR3]MCC8396865.1 amino acid ABC transporter permease [Paraburkholderia sp. MMS20-SJTR3]
MDFLHPLLPFAWRFVQAMGVTIELTALSFAMAFALGVALSVVAVSPLAPLRWFAATYVEIMRMTPLLALLLLFVFGLPKLGLMYSLSASSVLVLGFYTAAWVAEVLRAGVNAVPAGQIEAARSIGMRFDQVLSNVVIPQAMRTVIPPLGNLFVNQIKASSIAAAIGVFDITYTAQRINFETAQAVPTFAAAMVAYMALTIPLGLAMRRLEQKLAVAR